MLEIENHLRVERLIDSAIEKMSLDLKDISVLTEAASGNFVVTPLIAACAGAERVIAVTRDSRHGRAKEVKAYTEQWAKRLGVHRRIILSSETAHSFAHRAELVTNLGFVRPINRNFVESMPKNSAVSLMWETWEFREEDLDLDACMEKGIPVLGTNERDSRLQIFRYLGAVVQKLLLERDIEIFKSNILLLGSGYFGKEVHDALVANGAEVIHLAPSANWKEGFAAIEPQIKWLDAIVIAEHSEKFPLVGGETGIPLEWFACAGTTLIHLCGNLDYDGIENLGIRKYPDRKIEPGSMTVTTDYAGPRPVIELHTAGLKVGEALVRGMRKFSLPSQAIAYALQTSPAIDFPEEFLSCRPSSRKP